VTARFFVDENDLALGKALRSLHDDVVYPGHGDLPEIPRGALDDEWLPVAAALDLVVITRDQRIRYRPIEKRLWVEHGVRGFVLTGRDSQSTVASLAVLEHQWSQIEQLIIMSLADHGCTPSQQQVYARSCSERPAAMIPDGLVPFWYIAIAVSGVCGIARFERVRWGRAGFDFCCASSACR
jgi:hypothetical protein